MVYFLSNTCLLRFAVASKNALALSDAMIYLPKRTMIQGAARFYEHYIGTAITKKYAVYEAIGHEDEGWGWGLGVYFEAAILEKFGCKV